MPISVDFEQQLRGPWDTASGFLIDQLELLQAQLAPIITAASATPPTYDEGAWTPTITGDGGGSGQTYSAQLGTYIKIGKQVTVTYYVALSNKGTITGNVVIGGLPFPCRANYYTGAICWLATATAFVSMFALTAPSAARIIPCALTAASVSNNATLTTANMANSTGFIGSLTYFTP